MSILLIDGSNVVSIHRSANTALDANGEPVGMIVGTLRLISKLCQTLQPERCIFFIDGKNGSAKRKSLYKNYKAGRKPRLILARTISFVNEKQATDNADWQFNTLLSILETLPIQVVITDSHESDDAIAYHLKYRKRYYGDENKQTIICSCDRDFGQLVSDSVSIYNPINKSYTNPDNFLSKHEVSHQNWLFFRCITGDASDALPGVGGIGPATLKKVFDITSNEKFTIDSIKDLSDDNKVAKKLKDNIALIELNEKLMSLEEPLISLSVAEKLDYQFTNFEPKMNRVQFILKSSGLPFDIGAATAFNSLLATRKKHEPNGI